MELWIEGSTVLIYLPLLVTVAVISESVVSRWYSFVGTGASVNKNYISSLEVLKFIKINENLHSL